MIARILSRMAARFITPATAAHVLAEQAAAKRERDRLALAERKAKVEAELRAYVAAKAGRAA